MEDTRQPIADKGINQVFSAVPLRKLQQARIGALQNEWTCCERVPFFVQESRLQSANPCMKKPCTMLRESEPIGGDCRKTAAYPLHRSVKTAARKAHSHLAHPLQSKLCGAGSAVTPRPGRIPKDGNGEYKSAIPV